MSIKNTDNIKVGGQLLKKNVTTEASMQLSVGCKAVQSGGPSGPLFPAAMVTVRGPGPQSRVAPLLFLNYGSDQTVRRVSAVEGLLLDSELESWLEYPGGRLIES